MLFYLLFPIISNAQPIPCDHKAWLTEVTPTSGNLHNLNIKTLQSNLHETNPEFIANAIGYNVQDEKIYGINPHNYHLLSVDGGGNVTDYGIPEGLDLDFNYAAGDVAPEGLRMVAIAQNKQTGIDERLYTIRLEPPYFAGFVSITSIENVGMGDIAFDPFFDKAYGYDNLNKKIVSLATGGNVTGFSTESTPHTVTGLFFDEFAVLYGISQGKLIEFNKHTGVIVSEKNIQGGGADGCSCPYQLDFFQLIRPEKTVPCSEVIITYYFDNRAGSVYGEIDILDVLPDGFSITEIIKKPFFSTVVSGVGSNIFEVTQAQILLGVDSFSVRVYLDETVSGTYPIQSHGSVFPQAFDFEIPGDNPLTIDLDDAPILEIITEEKDIFDEEIKYLCEGGEVRLETNLNGVDFLWNDGSVESFLTVTEPGEYWVEIKSDCDIFKDFITIELEPEPLYIDLGEDLTLNFGQQFELTYASNSNNLSFEWSSDFPDFLSCQTCPNPIILPLENANYSVTVTNENGCTATDEIFITIREEIDLYAPNVFSPNNDGVNDRFFLQSSADFQIKTFRIFDRWGGLVDEKSGFPANDSSFGWDGKIKGKKSDEGVYLWYAEVEVLGLIREFGGSVLLLR